jgi:Acyl-CoA dehydrogenase, C-terminal domain
MTFELSAEHLALRDKARAVADTLMNRAADIDRTGVIPADVLRDATAACGSDPLGMVVAVEELAVASAAVAITATRRPGSAEPFGLAGLRGAAALDDSPRSQLVLAAAALGIARSALNGALDEIRRTTAAPESDVEKPHWVVADTATEVEAARLLTYKAAMTSSDADIAIGRLMTSLAAQHAVDTALRVAGAGALKDGGTLERLSRDVRAVALVLGTEER